MKFDQWWDEDRMFIESNIIQPGLAHTVVAKEKFRECHSAGMGEKKVNPSEEKGGAATSHDDNYTKIKIETTLNPDKELMKIIQKKLLKITKEAQLDLRRHGIMIDGLTTRDDKPTINAKLVEKDPENDQKNPK